VDDHASSGHTVATTAAATDRVPSLKVGPACRAAAERPRPAGDADVHPLRMKGAMLPGSLVSVQSLTIDV
jgi:hypothetical protein